MTLPFELLSSRFYDFQVSRTTVSGCFYRFRIFACQRSSLSNAAFSITPLGRWWEEFLYLAMFLSALYFAKFKFVKALVFVFFFLSFVANNVHFEAYQSWINGVNYYLAVIECTEVFKTGVTMVSQLLPGIVWGLVNCLIVAWVWRDSMRHPVNVSWPIADIVFLALIAFIAARSFHTNQEHGISPKASYGNLKSNYFSFGYFLGHVLPYQLFDLSAVEKFSMSVPSQAASPKVDHVIWIVGESESVGHVSAFGYARKTTPFFEDLTLEVLNEKNRGQPL